MAPRHTTYALEPTHYGLMFACVPVRVDMRDPDVPAIEVRHWAFEPLLEFCEAFYGALVYVRTALDPTYEPTFPLVLTGEARTGG